MDTCLTKYFGVPEMTRKQSANVLKNLVWTPAEEIRRMVKAGEFPACRRLLAGALLDDLEAGRIDTFNRIIDTVF
jgi:hypothetical protein